MAMISTPAARTLYYRVTQIRSGIGMPLRTRNTLKALGLKRRNQVAYVKCCTTSADSLAQVKELVKVEVTDVKKTKQEVNSERKWSTGFDLIKNGTQKVYE